MKRNSRGRRDYAAEQARRREAGRLFGRGLSRAEVARRLGVSRQSASRWFRRWRRGGDGGLRGPGWTGRPRKLPRDDWHRLTAVLQAGAKAHGFDTDLWTLGRIARGLDEKVLLVVTGEFGRTPRINPAIGTQTGVMQPGRDHWPQAMSILISGGGLKTGVVVGSTNAKAEHPKDRPLVPNDLWATVFRHLGIDALDTSFPDHRGRPMPILPFGQPIAKLV